MNEYRVKPRQNGKTLELLRDIDAALARMEAKGHAETIHYARLKAKRDAIASGEPYATYNITPYLIRAMGAQIPNVNFGKDGKLIKPRGGWRKHVAPAGRQICGRNGGNRMTYDYNKKLYEEYKKNQTQSRAVI